MQSTYDQKANWVIVIGCWALPWRMELYRELHSQWDFVENLPTLQRENLENKFHPHKKVYSKYVPDLLQLLVNFSLIVGSLINSHILLLPWIAVQSVNLGHSLVRIYLMLFLKKYKSRINWYLRHSKFSFTGILCLSSSFQPTSPWSLSVYTSYQSWIGDELHWYYCCKQYLDHKT